MLDQFDERDDISLRIDTASGDWLPGEHDESVMPLHYYETEMVALYKWPAGSRYDMHQHFGGEEIFVLSGELFDEYGEYPAGTWIRNPHNSEHSALCRGRNRHLDQNRSHASLTGVESGKLCIRQGTLTGKSCDGIEGDFHRVQFTPDLLPADLTGTEIYRPQDGSFKFQRGPLFHNLILADEINRAPAKVQSALLEAMEERQITVGAKPTRCRSCSWSWRRRIRSSRKAPIRCPKPSSTAS